MLKKIVIALVALIALVGLIATVESGAQACGEWSSAYARPHC